MADYKHRYRETYKGVKLDIRANTSAELNAKVNRKKQQIDRGFIDGSIRLLDFGTKYLEAYKKSKVSDQWYKSLTYMLHNLANEIGNRQMSSIKPIHIQGYLNSLSGYATTTIKKHYDFVRQLFHYAYRNGATTADYSLDLEAPTGKEYAKE